MESPPLAGVEVVVTSLTVVLSTRSRTGLVTKLTADLLRSVSLLSLVTTWWLPVTSNLVTSYSTRMCLS